MDWLTFGQDIGNSGAASHRVVDELYSMWRSCGAIIIYFIYDKLFIGRESTGANIGALIKHTLIFFLLAHLMVESPKSSR